MNRPAAHRRALLAALGGAAALALGTSLSGCGFALRQPPQMAFRTIMLTGFAGNSPLAVELARALEANGVMVVESSAQAATHALDAASSPLAGHVVLQALIDQRAQAAASQTAYGQVRDMGLTTRLKFILTRADGSVLIPPTEMAVARSLPYNEKDALARQDEYEAMHKAMQADLIEQLLRRLATVRP
jgi:LPS-assembly lipoprotein